MLNNTPYMRRFRGFMTPRYETLVKRAYEAMSDVERWIYHVAESNPTLVARNENDGDDTVAVTGMAGETQGVAMMAPAGGRPGRCRPDRLPAQAAAVARQHPADHRPTSPAAHRLLVDDHAGPTGRRLHTEAPAPATGRNAPPCPPPATELVPPH